MGVPRGGGADRKLSVLGAPTVAINETNVVGEGFEWEEKEPFFAISVANPEKKKKFGGLKKYTAYVVSTPSKGWSVLRRYKHFSWLHERLEKKFTAIPIPPLPEKSATGRFNQDFIEERRVGLTYFLNACSRHPVLRSSAVFVHFLSVDNVASNAEWKAGKRVYEKDEVAGENWFFSVASELAIDGQTLVPQLEAYNKDLGAEVTFSSTLEKQVEGLQSRWIDLSKALGSAAETYAAMSQVDEGAPSMQTAMQAAAKCSATLSQLGLEAGATEDILLQLLATHRIRMKLTQKSMKIEQSARSRYVSMYAKLQGKDPSPEDNAKLETLRASSDRKMSVAMAEISHYRRQRKVDFKRSMLAHIDEFVRIVGAIQSEYATLRTAVEGIDVDEAMYG